MKIHTTRETQPHIAVHKTLEDTEDGRIPILWVSRGNEVIRVKDAPKWVEDLPVGDPIRFTAVHAQDTIINSLVDKGHKIVYANWHKTGIKKGTEPDEIVRQFANLPEETFREFIPRPDLYALRFRVSQRLAMVEYRKAAILKLKASGRLFGHVKEEDYDEEVKSLIKEAESFDVRVPLKTSTGEKLVSLDTVIANIAKDIPECQMFNAAAHITGAFNTAASVVAFSGGVDRFDNVASFWHYCGQDPTSNKKKRGQAVTYSPRLKTILWQMSESIVKNRNNPWRDFYDAELEQELAVHMTKHPECKTPKGHSMARAKVKMRKEILKRFFLAVKGEEYQTGLLVKSERTLSSF